MIDTLASRPVCGRIEPWSAERITDPEKANNGRFDIPLFKYVAGLSVTGVRPPETIGLQLDQNGGIWLPQQTQLLLHGVAKLMRDHEVRRIWADLQKLVEQGYVIVDPVIGWAVEGIAGNRGPARGFDRRIVTLEDIDAGIIAVIGGEGPLPVLLYIGARKLIEFLRSIGAAVLILPIVHRLWFVWTEIILIQYAIAVPI